MQKLKSIIDSNSHCDDLLVALLSPYKVPEECLDVCLDPTESSLFDKQRSWAR
jgi:hypothetical protein